MNEGRFCLLCGKTIGMWEKQCPYCGEKQFGENDEYYPDEKSMKSARQILENRGKTANSRKRKILKPTYSDEEKLTLGLYPKDKGYKMSLISKILSKK